VLTISQALTKTMGFRPLTQESLTGAGGRALLTAATSTHTRGLLALAAAAAGAVLFAVYERLSATAPLTADSANAVLQGQSMAAGNLLLHGWTLSGASFYATDAPFYALFAAVRGLSPAVAHDVGALIYTLLVIAACFLARGSARGGEGLGRMLVTLVLLIAPAPGAATELLLLGPFHGGTTLVLLLALLALDAGETHPAWTAALGVLLALAVLSDALALYVGVVPVVVVLAARLAARGRAAGSDLAALAAALLALPAALVLGQLVHQLGGFETVPLQGSFAEVDDLPKNLALTVQGALLLFGANFFGQPIATPSTIVILVHLAGFGLVAMSCRWAVMAWRRGRQPDSMTQVLLVAMAVDLAAYLFSNQAIDLMTSRYLIPFMAFGAVLAGRVGAAWLWQGRRGAVAGAVAAAYVVFLAAGLGAPASDGQEAQVGAYLARHHLDYGLAAYWQASTVTVQTGGRVRVRALTLVGDSPSPYLWEAEGSWYDPSRPGNQARFVLRDTADSRSADRRAAEAAFGPPSSVYRVGHFEVLVWDRNLLADLRY